MYKQPGLPNASSETASCLTVSRCSELLLLSLRYKHHAKLDYNLLTLKNAKLSVFHRGEVLTLVPEVTEAVDDVALTLYDEMQYFLCVCLHFKEDKKIILLSFTQE